MVSRAEREDEGAEVRFEDLPSSAREFFDIIRDGIEEGRNKSQIQQDIKDAKEARGFRPRGIRDEHITQVRRFLNDEPLRPPPQHRFINKTKTPDDTRLDMSKGFQLRTYSHRIGIVDSATGEIIGFSTVSSSEELSIEEIFIQATSAIRAAGVNRYVEDEPEDFSLEILETTFSEDPLLDEED